MTLALKQKFDALSGFYLVLDDLSEVTNEPTGFVDPSLVVINYDNTTRKVTVTGTTTAYFHGALVATMISGYESVAHGTDLDKQYWLYYDEGGYQWADSFPGMEKMLIAVIIYNTNEKFALRECHGLMQWQAHFQEHFTTGTWRESGTITNGSYTLASTTAANRRPNVDATAIWDEDLKTINAALTTKLYTQAFNTGTEASPVVDFVLEAADIVPLSSARPYWNQLTGGNWTQTLLANNQYMSVWLIAVPVCEGTTCQKYRFMWIQGQKASTTLSIIQAETPANVNLADLGITPEYVFMGKIIIRYTGGNWVLTSVETIAGSKQNPVLISGGTGLTSVATDETLTGNGTLTSPLSTIPLLDDNGVYNSVKLPNTAYVSVADGYSTTLTFDSDGAMMLTVTYDGSVGIVANGCFSCPYVSVLSDPMSVFLPTDAGTGIYIGKGSASYNVVVKNRTGSAQNITIQSINSNITSATTWA